jgi:hypothetical protein
MYETVLSKDKLINSLIPPWAFKKEWHEVNEIIDHLMHSHRTRMDSLRVRAVELMEALEPVSLIFNEICAESCPWCPEPCCQSATVWYDFKDLLFLNLNRLPVPFGQIERIEKKGPCSNLGSRGCRLPRFMRPWVCTLYVCQTQVAVVRKRTLAWRDYFDRQLKALKHGRNILEADFIRITS